MGVPFSPAGAPKGASVSAPDQPHAGQPTCVGPGEGMGRGPQGFGHQRRLPGKADFDRVFATAAVRLSRHPFLLLASPGTGTTSRMGMVVGKRHAKRAVDRNRIRRQVRETFRQRSLGRPVDVVILARPGAGACSKQMLAESLEQLWARLEQQLQGNGEGRSGGRS